MTPDITPRVRAPSELGLRGVAVSFGGVTALSDVTFSVDSGELAAVVGPNGAGKSTILNAVSGLVRLSAGTILLDREKLGRQRPAVIAARGVGRSFQNPYLVDGMTVLENVLVGAHVANGYTVVDQLWRRSLVRRRERELDARARMLLDELGLSRFASASPRSLPYGPRKLVDIARAVVSRPRLLLLDEPTSGLDAREQAVVSDTLSRLRATGAMTMLLVEHHMDVVRAVASKVIGLQAGTVVAVGGPDEVLDSAQFRSAMVGRAGEDAPGGGGAGGDGR
jgi:branched-chain amino acid transport system ATP-binding protein